MTAAQGWYPDPAGLWEMRWWDGTTWSTSVATGGFQGTDALTPQLTPPADPNAVIASVSGMSGNEPMRFDVTWQSLNVVPLRRLNETRYLPLGFVARLDASGDEASASGELRLTVRGPGYVGPSTFVLRKAANVHSLRALALRQRAIITGWPPTA